MSTVSKSFTFVAIFFSVYILSFPILANDLEEVIAAANQGEKALQLKCNGYCEEYKNANSVCLLADIKPKVDCLKKWNFDLAKGVYSDGKPGQEETPEEHLNRNMAKTGIIAGAIAKKLTSEMLKACKKIAEVSGEMASRMVRLKEFCGRLAANQ